MKPLHELIDYILVVVPLALTIAIIVLIFLNAIDLQSCITLLTIGLLSLTIKEIKNRS